MSQLNRRHFIDQLLGRVVVSTKPLPPVIVSMMINDCANIREKAVKAEHIAQIFHPEKINLVVSIDEVIACLEYLVEQEVLVRTDESSYYLTNGFISGFMKLSINGVIKLEDESKLPA